MSAPQLTPGSVVAGKYSIVSCTGFGGASATYHARTHDMREVALKIFDPAIRGRADLMSALEQIYAGTNALPPDIAVPILDAGYDPATGAPFSVTERIPFPSLAQVASQRPLAPEEAVAMVKALGRLLDAAHARNLTHHAIKPTNVFVGFAQGHGVRVTDFGAGLSRTAVPTPEGFALSVPWLAPEQAQSAAHAGPPADVFATALVVFFALTGRSYWRSCQGIADVAGWHREVMGARTAPSQRASELGATLSPMFDGILGAALAADPTHRYRSVGELASALESLLPAGAMSAAGMAAPPPVPSAGGGSAYPPPPPPIGGLGMAPPGQSAPPPPMGAPMQQAAPEQSFSGGYAPAQAGYGGGAEPMSQPFSAAPPARSSSKTVPIVIGAVAAVLLLGGAGAWFAMGRSGSTEGSTEVETTAAAPGSATPAATAATAAVAAAAPDPSAVPAADADAGAPDADVDAGPALQEVSVTCDPACDEIKVDGKPIDASGTVSLTPGKHSVAGSKAGFASARDSITVVAGEKLEKQLKLSAAKAVTGPVHIALKPCGKFLKKNCK